MEEKYPLQFYMTMAASAAFFMSLHVMLPLLPRYALDVGANEALWGFAVTATASFAGSIRLLGGPFADKLGRRFVMIFGTSAMLLGALVFAFTDNYAGLLIGRMLQGIGLGTFTTSYKALIIDLAPAGKRGRAIGIGNLTFAIALLAAPPIGELIRNAGGYLPLFLSGALMNFISIGIILTIQVQSFTTRTSRSIVEGAKAVIPLPTEKAGFVGMFGVALLFVGVFTFLSLLADDRGFVGVGVAFSAYAVAELCGQILGGRLVDRMARRLVYTAGMLLGLAGVLLFLFAGVQLVMVVGAAFTGLGIAMARVNVDTMVAEGAPDDLRGTATGLQYAAFDLWIGLSSWGLGVVATNTTYETLFTLIAGGVALWVVVMWFVMPRKQPAGQPVSAAADR